MSFFAVRLVFVFLFVILRQPQLPFSTSISILEQGVAADHLGPLPTKTPIWSGDTDWDANLRTCTNFHFRQWQPAKPRTGKSNFKPAFKPNVIFACTVFAIWFTADFVRWNSCFLQGQRKNSSTLVFSPCHPIFLSDFRGLFVHARCTPQQ